MNRRYKITWDRNEGSQSGEKKNLLFIFCKLNNVMKEVRRAKEKAPQNQLIVSKSHIHVVLFKQPETVR